MDTSQIAPGVRETIAQTAEFVVQQKRDAEALAKARAKYRDVLARNPGARDAATTEDRQKAAIVPHRTSTKWEYAQWITEDLCIDYRNSRTETFDTDDPCDAWVCYEGDSDSPDRGKFLSQLLGQPEAQGYATDAEILNAIGANGWELVKVDRAKDKETETITVTRTFKRPRTDATGNPGKPSIQ